MSVQDQEAICSELPAAVLIQFHICLFYSSTELQFEDRSHPFLVRWHCGIFLGFWRYLRDLW